MLASDPVVASPRSRRRYLWRVPLATLVVALVLTTAAVIALRVAFVGPALASRVCARLNADMRGKIAIGSIDWPLASVPAVVRGGWVPVVMQDVQVTDADGVVVLRAPAVRAELDVHAVLFGDHDLVARRVVMDGGEVFLREVPERAPRFAGDTAVSLVAAFEARTPPRPGAASGGSRLELRDAEVRGAAMTIDALALRASLSDVSARGALVYDPRTSPPRLVFDVTPRGGPGELAIGGRRLALDAVDVTRLAQTDGATVELEGEVRLAGGERVHVAGALREYWPTGHFGPDSRLAVRISGLRHALAIEPPVELEVPALAILHDLHTGDGELAEVVGSVAGGSLRASARWGGGRDGAAPTWVTAAIATEAPIDLAPWLRPDVRRELGHTLRGKVSLGLDTAADGLVRVGSPELALERLRVDAGTLVVERANRLRLEGVHYTVPGLEGTYDCVLDPGPPVERSCEGRSSGDARVLLRLRKLDTW